MCGLASGGSAAARRQRESARGTAGVLRFSARSARRLRALRARTIRTTGPRAACAQFSLHVVSWECVRRRTLQNSDISLLSL